MKPGDKPSTRVPGHYSNGGGHFEVEMTTPIGEIGQAANFTNGGGHFGGENDHPHKVNWPGRQLYLWGWSF